LAGLPPNWQDNEHGLEGREVVFPSPRATLDMCHYVLEVTHGEVTTPTFWVTIEITRSAYAEVEADSQDEAHAKVDQLLEGGEIKGWEEDVPQIKIEELAEEDAWRRGRVNEYQRRVDCGILQDAQGRHSS
jgi:hypothetical protein